MSSQNSQSHVENMELSQLTVSDKCIPMVYSGL